MKKRTRGNGLAVLDIVMNGFASVLILFFIMSAFHPLPPIERVSGFLMIQASASEAEARFEIWARHRGMSEGWRGLLGGEVSRYTTVADEDWSGRLDGAISRQGGVELPVAMIYVSESDSRQVAFFRDPVVGEWEIGVLYVDNMNLPYGPSPCEFFIDVWRHETDARTNRRGANGMLPAPCWGLRTHTKIESW